MAYDLNGSNQSIDYTLLSSQTTLNTVTIGFWAWSDSYASNYKKWWYQGTAGDREIAMEMDSGYGSPTGFVFVSKWSGLPGVWSINAGATGAWHHYCVTYDWGSTANDPVMYLNGASSAVTERLGPSGTKDNNGTALNIGSEASSSNFYDGKICEGFIYNRILTAAEIAEIGTYKFSPLFNPRGLVFYDQLVNRSQDIMGGVIGTLDNSPSAYAHPPIIYPSDDLFAPYYATVGGSSAIKTINGLAYASIKSVNGLAIASVKTVNGLA